MLLIACPLFGHDLDSSVSLWHCSVKMTGPLPFCGVCTVIPLIRKVPFIGIDLLAYCIRQRSLLIGVSRSCATHCRESKTMRFPLCLWTRSPRSRLSSHVSSRTAGSVLEFPSLTPSRLGQQDEQHNDLQSSSRMRLANRSISKPGCNMATAVYTMHWATDYPYMYTGLLSKERLYARSVI